MQVIKDDGGKPFTLEVLTDTIVRVRAATGVDLLTIIGGELIERLFNDLALTVDVLYYCCEPQAKEQELDLDKWRKRWHGDSIEAALEVLLRETADFFPRARREVLHGMIDAMGKVLSQAERTARSLLAQTQEKIDEAEPKSVGSSSGSSPESSESIPAG